MSVQVSYKKQIALTMMLFFVILLVIEGIAQIFIYQNTSCYFADREAVSYIPIEIKRQICHDQNSIQLGQYFTNIPNQHYDTFNINSHGFRGGEITAEKPEGVYRIFVVGGSTTFGAITYSDDHTMPAYLQKKFDGIDLGVEVEVINAGASGSFSLPETLLVKNKIINLEPDLIIVYDGWNDIMGDFSRINNPERDTNWSELKKLLLKFRAFELYKTPLAYEKIKNDLRESFPEIYQRDFDETTGPQIIELWTERWQDICLLGKEQNFDTLITIQPIVGTGNKTLTDEEMSYYILDNGEKIIPYYDLFADGLNELQKTCTKTADLRGIYDDFSHTIYIDGGHVADEGKQIIAERLFEISTPLILEKIE